MMDTHTNNEKDLVAIPKFGLISSEEQEHEPNLSVYLEGFGKFWKCTVENNKVVITYGRLCTVGKRTITSYSSNEKALAGAKKLIEKQISKGYSEEDERKPSKVISQEEIRKGVERHFVCLVENVFDIKAQYFRFPDMKLIITNCINFYKEDPINLKRLSDYLQTLISDMCLNCPDEHCGLDCIDELADPLYSYLAKYFGAQEMSKEHKSDVSKDDHVIRISFHKD